RKEVRDQTFIDRTDNLFHINQPREFDSYVTENGYDSKEIYRVVHSLPRDYRIPFLMHISGFKYREIADRLNLPLGTVKSRIFFTRQQLQVLLKDYRK
ncbi:MAG: RNA polymerase sigma factor, partial [Bacteroidaceae bacterium]|nr:RNA polymerase sigma factor [Bacteroidaceae bacterium]